VVPVLLIGGLLVAQRRFPDELTTLTSILIILGVLQVIALAVLVRPRWRAQTLAFCAVLALWSVYILVFEPVERRLYDSRIFSRAAFALVQKDPAPLVLHAMGKDAKAIKFMVNIDEDFQPVFTESIQELESLTGPDWLMMDDNDYKALKGTSLGNLQPALRGRFDKNDFVLLHKQPQ
jgi:hypothetical protein